nr:MAG TPA: hypothetical protein [Caudoviricetes sp.]
MVGDDGGCDIGFLICNLGLSPWSILRLLEIYYLENYLVLLRVPLEALFGFLESCYLDSCLLLLYLVS